ncbi:ribonuclease III [Sphingobium lignivorans]|uniref:Ribonuclease 3 n=1 Tax=Sphingobium lignivorans TaxID=2735886 RepID=A0ABR6NIQ4_9SPHN|nr:ribonuclease III [Sphingobium lignivorans]MBB5986393.1 ribonuclease-3 [Sphingobium lignivorans]
MSGAAPDAWLAGLIGREPRDKALYEQALTHGSASADHYERLEFLGDRVLGLVMADWLYQRFPQEKEGQLSRRFNHLVAGGTCARVARAIGVRTHLRLGKQARDDGAVDSDNVLGDVMEALIGALYLDAGMDAATGFVRRLWEGELDSQASAPKHPKSALQEWAAANHRRPPEYSLVERSGPQHALRFTVSVTIKGAGEARGEGHSKQEAETAAATALLTKLSG